MVIYNALPRKEYERIFMCNTEKEIWKTLLITHQSNNQVKDNKIDLLVQQYEQFVISKDESIDSAFARFNTIINSLKALDEGYSSKNYVRKFLRALHPKWRAKVTAIEELKDLTSLSLDELIGNLKVHEVIIKKDFEIVKAKGERKSLALKAKKESSDEVCGDLNHLIGECPKPSKDKNQRAFVEGSWSDSGEEDDEKAKDETCLVAQAANEIYLGVDMEPDEWIKDSRCSKHMTDVLDEQSDHMVRDVVEGGEISGGNTVAVVRNMIGFRFAITSERIMPPRRFKKKSVKRLVEKRVAKAIEEYEKTRVDSNNIGGSGLANTRGTVAPEVQGCSYKTFTNGKPHSFNGTEGVVGLKRWLKKIEQVFDICKCAEDDKVKFAVCTFEGRALTWWNGNVQTLGLANANRIPWNEFKSMMTSEYCLATKIQRMEQEFWTLTLKSDDIEGYNNRFHELALMCPELVAPERKKIECFIRGLPEKVKANVTSSKPASIHEAINMAHELVEQAIQAKAIRVGKSNKKKLEMPQELSRVHHTFHVSNLKKCLSDEPLAIPLEEIHIDDKLNFVEEPVEIMDREVKRLKQCRILIIKVRWNSRQGAEYTWEREDQFRKKYPHLFSEPVLSSSVAT
ncbi:zf-CCHC domain-containing protein [Tanacetum coccineum]